MIKELTKEEKTKINDFMNVYKIYLNPNCNEEINKIINYVTDSLIKVYFEYKNVVPFVSVEDDNYNYYILKPIDDRYSLLDYLINTVIQNLDSIELIDNKMCCNYNIARKKIEINKNDIMLFHPSFFDTMRGPIDKDKFLELYYKHSIYHEIGHMLHYKIDNIKADTVYVPSNYLSLSEFPPLKKRMSLNDKKAEIERRKSIVKEQAKEKIKRKISIFTVLSNKYNVLNPDEIDNCDIAGVKINRKYEEIIVPLRFFLNPVEEALTECDAQFYSGIFENQIFEMESGELNCFNLPIDNEHILMTYAPSTYSFSASIGLALKRCISKQSYFRTLFLGKNDLFLEFLGEYELCSANLLSWRLISADEGKMNEVQPLLDYIIDFYKNKGECLNSLNLYFPLIYNGNKWVYYTDTIDKESVEILKLQSKSIKDDKK